MRKTMLAALLSGLLLTSGCASLLPGVLGSRAPTGAELVGQRLRLVTPQGQASTMHFLRGGLVRAVFGQREVMGRWQVGDGRLCFLWTGAPRECWRYTEPFRRGRTERVQSDRGNITSITLL